MDTQPTILSQEQINNLPLFEFFNYCKNTPQIDNLTIYNYIKHITNDFDEKSINIFAGDLLRYNTKLLEQYTKNMALDLRCYLDSFYTNFCWRYYNLRYINKAKDSEEHYYNMFKNTVDFQEMFIEDFQKTHSGISSIGKLINDMSNGLFRKRLNFSYQINLGLNIDKRKEYYYDELPTGKKQIINNMINFFTSKIEQNREKYQYFVRYKKSERIFADTEKAYYTTPEYYIDCVAREEFNSSKIEENRNQKTKEQKHSTPHLSKKLDTKQFKQVLKKAIDKGLIETNDDRYVWKGTKALFGYFVQKMNDYLKLKHGEKLDLKSFSETFNISTNKISSAIQDYKKGNKEKPLKFEKVDSLMI